MPSSSLIESTVENHAIHLLEEAGYTYMPGPDISPGGIYHERDSFQEVILKIRLQRSLKQINPEVPAEFLQQAVTTVSRIFKADLITSNEDFHDKLCNGIDIEFSREGELRSEKVHLIDYHNPENNDFLVVNQFTVEGPEYTRRPDIILFVNGLPLVVFEMKRGEQENVDLRDAWQQIQTYKKQIPALFHYNGLVILSDGFDALMGSLSAPWSRFLAWKSVDGIREDKVTVPQLNTLIRGMLQKDVILDMLRHFIVFEHISHIDTKTGQVVQERIKIVAAYHQYYAVNKAIESTHHATAREGDRKAGVIWHTQGSGKSLSMVFYSGKLVLQLDNPTIIVITDRNDLDDQLFDTFSSSRSLLRQDPSQIENREELRDALNVAAGGIIFTTIQKFFPEEGEKIFPLLSDRRNIVVIADEAHRSQYGFKAKTVYITDKDGKEIGTKTAYGFAKYIRDALPNASFIGFTGTPVEKEDANTPAVFGNYIDIYDIAQAVEDGATVKIYYESRVTRVKIKEGYLERLDLELARVAEDAGEYHLDAAKTKWSSLEAIVGDEDRLNKVAEDMIHHFEERQKANDGKGMFVAMTRRIAVDLYEKIIELRPEWHSKDLSKGAIKVVMTSAASDPDNWQQHHTTKQQRKLLADRMRDPDDELKMVIVRDMWLTGFDVPCLHTMYIDKPMQGHNLMQAIARVNRVYKDKAGGLIVDYIGVADDLRRALKVYSESGGKGSPTLDTEQAVHFFMEKLEVVRQMYHGYYYQRFFTSTIGEKLTIILEAQDHILGLDEGKERYLREVTALSKALSLVITEDAVQEYKEEVGFFQAVKVRLAKFTRGRGLSRDEVDTAVKRLINEAIEAQDVVDVFDAAGLKRPDISVISDEFLAEVKRMKYKNLAAELLRKLLNDEIRVRTKWNVIEGKKFSEMLQQAVQNYEKRFLSLPEFIEELTKLGREIKAAEEKGEELGLTQDEYAFYSALAANKSARDIMGDEKLAQLTHVLLQRVKDNTSIDWQYRENARAKLRRAIKRLLREYGYPPDMEKLAMENVIRQAEMMAENNNNYL